MMKKFLLTLISAVLLTFGAHAADNTKVADNAKPASNSLDMENILLMKLKDGKVMIQMYPDKAPNHVARIKELTRQKFYDGLKFHRVIDGFMAQTGDPLGNGTGGSGKKLKAEFNDLHHGRGTVSMARASDPDSADSQFFICFADAGNLDGQYTVWGKVIEGMEFVDKIKRGDKNNNGAVEEPADTIISMAVLGDVSTPTKK